MSQRARPPIPSPLFKENHYYISCLVYPLVNVLVENPVNAGFFLLPIMTLYSYNIPIFIA